MPEQETEDEGAKLVPNERAKLTATWLNSISVAMIAVGGIAPLVATVTGAVAFLPALGSLVVWLLIAVGLHFGARAVLHRLRE